MAGSAAKEPAEPPIEVRSLMGALEDILEVPVGRRTVKVCSLEVHHASALVEMLHFQTSRRNWKVNDFRKLKIFVSADAILLILEDAVLPIVAKDPTSLPALHLLERYGNRLQTLSVSVGGTFEEEVDFINQELMRFIENARAEETPVHDLVDKVNLMRASVSALRKQMVGIGDHVIIGEDSAGESGDED